MSPKLCFLRLQLSPTPDSPNVLQHLFFRQSLETGAFQSQPVMSLPMPVHLHQPLSTFQQLVSRVPLSPGQLWVLGTPEGQAQNGNKGTLESPLCWAGASH